MKGTKRFCMNPVNFNCNKRRETNKQKTSITSRLKLQRCMSVPLWPPLYRPNLKLVWIPLLLSLLTTFTAALFPHDGCSFIGRFHPKINIPFVIKKTITEVFCLLEYCKAG